MELREGPVPDPSRPAWERAARARERARRALSKAAGYDLLAASSGSYGCAEVASVHRRTAECHLSSARLQETYARHAARWSAAGSGGPRPLFMGGVAEACGAESAALALVGADQSQLAFATSDPCAERAQELEFVLDEGPGRDAALLRVPVSAGGDGLAVRWPRYGPGLAGLGVGEVLAVPLTTPGACLGALTILNRRPRGMVPRAVAGVAAALTHSVLLGPDADPGLYGEADHRDRVQLAAGMVSVQAGCAVADALALIKARAFADGLPTAVVALAVTSRELRLGL
ncbi:GAF domain-containing protein [Streptomyces iconiensis]|uniref:GAF domain-containing protein n=1 Tax=Streptomyces iconiensis TaxID=1384038 RepID=A0ABT7A0M8_9ACTN|nr:GAF domain-containing protein [Streptomyces iconiensis]MDJ1134888.1 GAF domain-containing protein [Streptomyces iconiensis]